MVMMDLPSARRQKKVLEIKIQPVPLEPPPPLLRSPPAPGRRLLAGQAQSTIPPRNRNIPPICLGGWCVVPLDSIQLFKRYRRRRERERTTTTVTTIAITTTATCYSYSSHYSYYVLCTVTTHLHPPTTVGACHVVLQYPTYRSPPLRLPPLHHYYYHYYHYYHHYYHHHHHHHLSSYLSPPPLLSNRSTNHTYTLYLVFPVLTFILPARVLRLTSPSCSRLYFYYDFYYFYYFYYFDFLTCSCSSSSSSSSSFHSFFLSLFPPPSIYSAAATPAAAAATSRGPHGQI